MDKIRDIPDYIVSIVRMYIIGYEDRERRICEAERRGYSGTALWQYRYLNDMIDKILTDNKKYDNDPTIFKNSLAYNKGYRAYLYQYLGTQEQFYDTKRNIIEEMAKELKLL